MLFEVPTQNHFIIVRIETVNRQGFCNQAIELDGWDFRIRCLVSWKYYLPFSWFLVAPLNYSDGLFGGAHVIKTLDDDVARDR